MPTFRVPSGSCLVWLVADKYLLHSIDSLFPCKPCPVYTTWFNLEQMHMAASPWRVAPLFWKTLHRLALKSRPLMKQRRPATSTVGYGTEHQKGRGGKKRRTFARSGPQVLSTLDGEKVPKRRLSLILKAYIEPGTDLISLYTRPIQLQLQIVPQVMCILHFCVPPNVPLRALYKPVRQVQIITVQISVFTVSSNYR